MIDLSSRSSLCNAKRRNHVNKNTSVSRHSKANETTALRKEFAET